MPGRFDKTDGAVAQLGERLNGIQEASGSIPLSSTKTRGFATRRSPSSVFVASRKNRRTSKWASCLPARLSEERRELRFDLRRRLAMRAGGLELLVVAEGLCGLELLLALAADELVAGHGYHEDAHGDAPIQVRPCK